MRRAGIVGFGLVILAGLFWCISAGAQNNDGSVGEVEESEILKIGVRSVEPYMFNPQKQAPVVITGELIYGTKKGTFTEPEVTCNVAGANIILPVATRVVPLGPEYPPEFVDLMRHWEFTVRWDGKEPDGLFVVPGRYDLEIRAKVLKTDIVKEKNSQGEMTERSVEIPSEKATSAAVIIVRE